MEIQALEVERREAQGSAAARRLRRQGKVPGVLYGHGQEVVPLTLPAEAVHEVLETGRKLVTLKLGGVQERALVKEVQFDSWGREILHVDFSRVALDEVVNVEVEIIGHGTPKAALSGGVLEQPLRRLPIACKADAIPDSIRAEVSAMETGHMIHVRDLQLPEGVKALADADGIVFIVKEARVEEVVAAPAPEAAVAEPEVIGRAAKAEAEEGEEQEKEKEKA